MEDIRLLIPLLPEGSMSIQFRKVNSPMHGIEQILQCVLLLRDIYEQSMLNLA